MGGWLARAIALHEGEASELPTVPEPAKTGSAERIDPHGQNGQKCQNSTFGTFDAFGTPPLSISEGPADRVVEHPSPFAAGLVGEWQRALSGLHRERAPCPLFRHWPEVLRAAERFLLDHGEVAVRLGWSDLDLFGVHRLVGTIRADCSGALMMSGGTSVADVTAELVRFSDGSAYRRAPWPPGDLVIPVWEFGA